MSISKLDVIYGNIDGAAGKFPRDPTGHLAIKAGIFRSKGLDVSWTHVQGTEERYRRLESGSAHISLVVGRAALQHFLDSKTTRILGSSMNSCPYYLVVNPIINELGDLKGKSLACLECVARVAPLAQTFQNTCGISLDQDVILKLVGVDQDAFNMLISGTVQAALLPRPYGLLAEEVGFKKMVGWPEVVDDALPVMIETTEVLLREKEKDFAVFLEAHSEGIRYLKANRNETIRMLEVNCGHSPSLAAKAYDEYLIWLDDRMTVDFRQLGKLLGQVAPDMLSGAHQLASQWIHPGMLRS